MKSKFMLSLLTTLPAWFSTLLIAAMPVLEIRGALPIALEVFHLPFWQAYALGVAGNMLSAIILVFVLKAVAEFVSRHSSYGARFFHWWFFHTRAKFQKSYDLYGALALFLFVAVPLPVTGVWTASVATVLFGIRPKAALPAMFLGVCTSGLIVGLVVGAVKLVV